MRDLAQLGSAGIASVSLALLLCQAALPGAAEPGDPLLPASLVQILVAPERYEGRRVNVVGYLAAGPQMRLFITRDHARVLDLESSVEVESEALGASDCMEKYARVVGKLARVNTIWRIVEVERVARLDAFESCWP
ncbi:MAG: hypothetical protein OEM49_12685 [Myxococcales bacterium]|nr:hypothetical protein [Myxococcales bacterium]MDH5308297.1 hypothetical protein [Myxococcales bacterium]MDH5567221.1 hypothetical protein [Myxococcales bacterium]